MLTTTIKRMRHAHIPAHTSKPTGSLQEHVYLDSCAHSRTCTYTHICVNHACTRIANTRMHTHHTRTEAGRQTDRQTQTETDRTDEPDTQTRNAHTDMKAGKEADSSRETHTRMRRMQSVCVCMFICIILYVHVYVIT